MAGRVGGPRPSEDTTLPSPEETPEDLPQPHLTPDQYLLSACRIDPNALIDTEALQQEYLRVVDDLHYYLPQMLEAIEQAALAELNVKEIEATTRLAIRRRYKDEKVSEASVDAEVTINPTVMTTRRSEISARKEEIRMKRVISIIERKASMLIQLGADMRQDKQQGLTIRDRNREVGEQHE